MSSILVYKDASRCHQMMLVFAESPVGPENRKELHHEVTIIFVLSDLPDGMLRLLRSQTKRLLYR